MDSVGSILPKVLRKRGLHGHAVASFVTFRAQEWLDSALPQFRGQIAVRKLSHGVLDIERPHSVALQECNAILPQLLETLRRECEGITIEDIRVHRARRKGG